MTLAQHRNLAVGVSAVFAILAGTLYYHRTDTKGVMPSERRDAAVRANPECAMSAGELKHGSPADSSSMRTGSDEQSLMTLSGKPEHGVDAETVVSRSSAREGLRGELKGDDPSWNPQVGSHASGTGDRWISMTSRSKPNTVMSEISDVRTADTIGTPDAATNASRSLTTSYSTPMSMRTVTVPNATVTTASNAARTGGPNYEASIFGDTQGKGQWVTHFSTTTMITSSAGASTPTANVTSKPTPKEGHAGHVVMGTISSSASLPTDCRTSVNGPSSIESVPPSEIMKGWRAAEAETLANCATANRWAAQIAVKYSGMRYDATGVWGNQTWIVRAYAAYLRDGASVINAWHLAGSPEPIEWLCRSGYDSPLYLEAYEADGTVQAEAIGVTIHYGRLWIDVPLLDLEYFDRRGLPRPTMMADNDGKMTVRVWFRSPCVKDDDPVIVGWSLK